MAGPTVTFHGRLDDGAVTELMHAARAVCVPGAEDFGIVPVEAQAAGKPVIALARGGALETVEDGVTGALLADHDTESVLAAIMRCDALQSPPEQIAEHARRFSNEAFRESLLATIEAAQAGEPAASVS